MLQQYQIHITRYAYNQISEIRHYIAEELFAPDAAKNLLIKMKKTISTLESMPFRNPLIAEEPWHTEGIRRIIVDNFYIYYWINDKKKQVHVIAVLYNKRNQLRQLINIDFE